MQKKFYRNTDKKMIAGVIAGLADYFNFDVTLLRLIVVLFILLTGFFPGVIMYAIAWIVVPVHDGSPRIYDVEAE
jgi:phage shock protein C